MFEHLLLNPLINNNLHSMMTDHQLSCKSILKRKSLEIPIEDSPAPVIKPAEDSQPAQCSSSNNFNLKSYRQGILKKQSACSSFDDDSAQKTILKYRCQSCDDETMLNLNELHSILKRKTSEPCDSSEPHGILKKRDHQHLSVQHQQQQSSDHDHHHVATTATTVGVADDDVVKPILKQKKSESDSTDENGYPKPILKKKSVECLDDKRSILKSSSRRDSSTKRATSKRLSVAQRVSNLESIMCDSDVHGGKAAKENARSSRDRLRFHTQPVTPDEIKAIKK